VATESSVTHFCTFVEFYTRKSTDPVNTALVCEEQAEVLQLDPRDLTSENMQLLIDTMLNAIDHLGKKWLDEQIQHETRKQQHRQDVAHLHQQLIGLQRELRARPQPLHQKGLRWLQQHLGRHAPKQLAVRKQRLHKPPKEAVAW
jgi:hypothetical protein